MYTARLVSLCITCSWVYFIILFEKWHKNHLRHWTLLQAYDLLRANNQAFDNFEAAHFAPIFQWNAQFFVIL